MSKVCGLRCVMDGVSPLFQAKWSLGCANHAFGRAREARRSKAF